MPKMPNAHSIMVPIPPPNARERNSDSATIGCSARDSMSTNSPPASTARASAPRMVRDVQPLSWPSMSA